ncbi:DUF4062 domain-containing protein [Desulfosporosinus fructosivorans]|uniref:DUF4062 domain-containing protein n=1 Tax=Desulfosporosinus fructosivorans TaxID=2018669 RepID=A0A4Z0R592_9FIRM|nr:DUF4062 domain-containing protein [Desulfosporosinus fructosivorans]TGE37505.1 DUF4062 domain-containing protein [Desulfosporosinus fructosivorans]
MRKLQVFISSTFTDLIEERQAAVEAILAASHIPAGMELFSASSESQLEVIKRWIDESDIFLLILGGRYGTIEPISGKSYTQLEYEYAVSSGKPFFGVIITDSALDTKVQSSGKSALELQNPNLYGTFKELVKSKMCKFYNDTKDIKLAVYETLTDFRQRYTLTGWVSGKELHDSEKYINEIARLLDENNELRNRERELLNRIDHIKKESKSKANNSIDIMNLDDLSYRIERIVELLDAQEEDGELVWINGVNDMGEDIEFTASKPRGEFKGYYFYEKDESSIAYLGILFVDEDDSLNIVTILAEIRMMLKDYKDIGDDMVFRFIVASLSFTDELKSYCIRFFEQVLEKLNLDTEDFILEIWDQERLLDIERDLGLFLDLKSSN